MKLKRKLLAGLLTLCMAVVMAVPAFAANGPSSGDMSSAWVQLVQGETGKFLYSNSGKVDTVEGAVYDKATNTITLTNYNHPEMTLATNEMGDDLKLHLVGDNHIAELVVWGFGWGGNLEITGDGSLTINENKTSQTAAIRFMAEGTQGLLKVGSNASVTAYKSAGENTYSAAFVSTTSSTLPFTGNLETELALTADSGVELEYEQTETVITEAPYESRTWQVATKGNDGRLYGVYFFEADETIGSQGQTDIAELVKVNDLPSGNEYLALEVKIIQGSTEWPAEYTKDADGKTIEAKIDRPKTMKVLKKGEETFYWGTGNIKYDEEGEGTPYYTLYKAIDKVELPDTYSDARYETNVVTPVDGMEDITADQEGYPEGYKTVIEKTGMYSYYCTNDVIKVSPSGTSTDPGTDPGTKPGEDTGAKDLTASETGVSISLTNGVPEGAELFADTIAQESVLGSRPELKEELPGLLSIYDISVRKDGKALEIRDNPMTVKIPMNDHLKGYKYYQAVYLGDPLERFDAVAEGDFLVFETTHLSQYAILGSNTPFSTSTVQDGEQTGAGDQSSDTTIPQTGDGSNMMLWIGLLAASGAGVYGMTLYSRKKKEQNI